MHNDPDTNLFKLARDEVALEQAAGAMLDWRRNAAESYMQQRSIGKSAVDLIPDAILRPCGPIRTNNQFNWIHTPGRMKLSTLLVRIAIAEIK